MKIIKPGVIDKHPLIFVCDECGCEFEADDTEYWTCGIVEKRLSGKEARCMCPCCLHSVEYPYTKVEKRR